MNNAIQHHALSTLFLSAREAGEFMVLPPIEGAENLWVMLRYFESHALSTFFLSAREAREFMVLPMIEGAENLWVMMRYFESHAGVLHYDKGGKTKLPYIMRVFYDRF
jgi:hypothetical protein